MACCCGMRQSIGSLRKIKGRKCPFDNSVVQKERAVSRWLYKFGVPILTYMASAQMSGGFFAGSLIQRVLRFFCRITFDILILSTDLKHESEDRDAEFYRNYWIR